MKSRTKLWRGITYLATFTLLFSIIAGITLEAWTNVVDGYFGTSSYKVQTNEVEGEPLFAKFTSDYESSDDIVETHERQGAQLLEEGAVLLKNNNVLPLDSNSKITTLGLRSSDTGAVFGASFGIPVPTTQNVTLSDALVAEGYEVNPTTLNAYNVLAEDERFLESLDNNINAMSHGSSVLPGEEHVFNPVEPTLDDVAVIEPDYMNSIAEYNDAAIVVIGRPAAESADFFPGETGVVEGNGARNSLSLTDVERDLINFATENFDNVVVLLNAANAMEIQEIEDNEDVDAFLWIAHPGNYGFNGVARILNGTVSPSGHLPDTVSSDSTSSPAMANYGVMTWSNAPGNIDTMVERGDYYLIEAEGIYAGYRYYETRYADLVMGQGNADSTVGAFDSSENWRYEEEVTYPFGFGLSYTTFEQTLDGVEVADDIKTLSATVTVTNTGDVAGKDVVQFYAQAPYIQGGVEKSAIQLIEYGKTSELQPGESQTVEITADLQNLASYDDIDAKTYILDGGTYYFTVGNGSHAAVNNVLAAMGYTTEDGMTSEGNADNALTWEYNPEGGVDTETFAISNSGVEVTNKLQHGDINSWLPDTATYLSRSDWSGTWPQTYEGLEFPDEMLPYLKNDFYEIKTDDDTSHIVWNDKSSDVTFTDLKGSDFDDPRWEELLDKLDIQEAIVYISKGNRQYQDMESVGFVGGTYTENGPNGVKKPLATYSVEISPYYVSQDDPNAAYEMNTFGSAPLFAATFNKEFLHEVGVAWGEDSLWSGIPMIWGPGLNVHRHPYNGRNVEYYSEDPVLSGTIGSQLIQGGYEKGLVMAPKHLAFNDQEANRNGISPFMNEQKARELDLRSFQISVEDGALGFMTGFNRFGPVWTSADPALLIDVVREEWGFDGYIVSDMIWPGSYMTWKEGVIASTSNFDTTEIQEPWFSYITEDTNAFENDTQMQEAIKDSVHTSLWVFAQSNLVDRMNSSTKIIDVNTPWRTAYKSVFGISTVVLVAGAVLYLVSANKEKNSMRRCIIMKNKGVSFYLIIANAIFAIIGLIFSFISSNDGFPAINLNIVIGSIIAVIIVDIIIFALANNGANKLVLDILRLISVVLPTLALGVMIYDRAELMGYVWFSQLEAGNPVAMSAMNNAVISWVFFVLAAFSAIIGGFLAWETTKATN